MSWGGKAVLPVLLACAASVVASQAAAGLLPPREHNKLVGQLDLRPMIFFAAKGATDSCGHGCSEWISAVGVFDDSTAQRFRDVIRKLNGRNLPIFFHSPGGSVKAAIEVGSILRERRMSAGVGRADTKCRVFDKRAACHNLIQAGRSIDAKLNTNNAQCHSACVYAFAGASFRLVASNAMLGVHAGRLHKKAPAKVTPAFLQEIARRYYLEMGVDPALADIEAKTPHQRIYILNRSEIAQFGLETRDDRYETSWRSSDIVGGKFVVMKSVTMRSSAEPPEYLTYRFQFTCSAVTGKPYFLYQRELALHSGRITKKVGVKFGDEDFSFMSRQNNVGVEVGVSNAIGSFTKLADAKVMTLIEKSTLESPDLRLGTSASEMKLSTTGLAQGLEQLRQRCNSQPPPTSAAKLPT